MNQYKPMFTKTYITQYAKAGSKGAGPMKTTLCVSIEEMLSRLNAMKELIQDILRFDPASSLEQRKDVEKDAEALRMAVTILEYKGMVQLRQFSDDELLAECARRSELRASAFSAERT